MTELWREGRGRPADPSDAGRTWNAGGPCSAFGAERAHSSGEIRGIVQIMYPSQ